MDALFGFAEKFHVYEKLLRWDIPIPQAARYARRVIPDDVKTLIISPCSSHPAALAAGTTRRSPTMRSALGLRVVLCGGRSETEQRMGEAIVRNMKRALREHRWAGHAARISSPHWNAPSRSSRPTRAGAHGDGRRHAGGGTCMQRPILHAPART